MTTNFYPANTQWLGLAKETTYGTPAATPTVFVPVVSPKWTPQRAVLTDQGLRGSMGVDYGQQQGLAYEELAYSTFPYLDSLYPHFLAALGTPDAITGSSDPYTHKTALYNGSGTNSAQPPSYTLWYFDAAGKCRQIPGAVSSNLKLDVKADALAGIDAGWMGLPGTWVTPPSNTPTTLPPFPSWNSTITVGGTALTKYSEVALTYKRATEMIPTITGTQSPFAIFCGPLQVSGDLTAVYQGSTDNDLAAWLANTQPALVVKTAPAGDATHYLQLTHSVVAYDSSSPQGTNKWMELASKVKALANATDALSGGLSPAQAVFLTSASTAF